MDNFLWQQRGQLQHLSYVAATGSNGEIVPAAAPAGKLAGVPTTNSGTGSDTGSGTGGTGATGGSASGGTSGGSGTGGSGSKASGTGRTAAAGPTSIDGGPGRGPAFDASGAIIIPDQGGTVVGDDPGVDMAQRAASVTGDNGAGAGGAGSSAVATRSCVVVPLGLFMLLHAILLCL